MIYYDTLNRIFGKWHPLPLAILIDILMIIPFVDFIITFPLQWILWSKIDNDVIKYINITYDGIADFAIPVVGDLFPLNTVSVIGVLAYKKIEEIRG